MPAASGPRSSASAACAGSVGFAGPEPDLAGEGGVGGVAASPAGGGAEPPLVGAEPGSAGAGPASVGGEPVSGGSVGAEPVLPGAPDPRIPSRFPAKVVTSRRETSSITPRDIEAALPDN